jgi:hypothetical protein
MTDREEFEKWYTSNFEGDMFWSKKDDCYIPIKAHYMWLAWQHQQEKIDELQMAFNDCCIRKLSAEQHIERQQNKIDELEDKIEGLKFDVSQAYTHN